MDAQKLTEPPDAVQASAWHLHWQAALGQSFLPNPALAERIRDRLVAAHADRGRVLVAYAILPTEIHLIARLREGDRPGNVARAIGSVVARWVREAMPVRSPVMGGPFHAFMLETDDAVRRDIRMLAWRPAFLRLCRGPSFYPHGALRVALGMRPGHGFDARPLLRLFGDSTVQARPALRRWIVSRPSDLDWHTWELARGLTLAPSHGVSQPRGFRLLKAADAASLVAMAGAGGVDAALASLADWVCWRGRATGAIDQRLGKQVQAARVRAIVARIAVEHGLCSAAFVARYFGKAAATLCEQMNASRQRKADARLVSVPMTSILEEIQALNRTKRALRGGAF